MNQRSIIVRSIWAACLVIGGINHARILIQNGLSWDYGGVGGASAVYWSSLTIFDPLVALLLFIRPKIGILCTILLIVTNVIHNLWVTTRHIRAEQYLSYVFENPFLLSQIAFMLFALFTARMAWNGATRNRREPVSPN